MAVYWSQAYLISPVSGIWYLIHDGPPNQDDDRATTMEMESINHFLETTVEQLRGTPQKFRNRMHKEETETVDAEKIHPSKWSTPRPRPLVFSDCEDDEEEWLSTLSLEELEQSLQEVNFQEGAAGIPTSTPLPSTSKAFQFKGKCVQGNARPQKSDTLEDDDDDISSIDRLGTMNLSGEDELSRTDDNRKHLKSGASMLEDCEDESLVQTDGSSKGQAAGASMVEGDSSEYSDKESPKRIQPPNPKAVFSDQLPSMRKSANGKAQPPVNMARRQVSLALKTLKETLELIPPPDSVAMAPRNLQGDLYPHQTYGLQWLWWRESHFPGGGILADEMGTGKTAIILALILKSQQEGSPAYKSDSWLSTAQKLGTTKCTLIVVSPSEMAPWEEEIKKWAPGLRVGLHHGPKRVKVVKWSQYDVLISTYQTLGKDIPDEQADHPLLKWNFERIVLDDGHIIRNGSTGGAFACFRIHAQHRWIVTGTPVHNTLADMHSLIRFLRVSPFENPALWHHWIGHTLTKLSANADNPGLNVIRKSLILRRTKAEIGAPLDGLVLPPKFVKFVTLNFTQKERRIYDFMERHKNYALEQCHKRGGALMESKLFTHLVKLRQCCVLPFLLLEALQNNVAEDTMSENDVFMFHRFLKKPEFANNFESTKIKRLLSDLADIRDNCLDRPTMDKVVVVSQWKTLLNCIKSHLEDAGHGVCEMHGKVKLSHRSRIIKGFNTPSSKFEVMLLVLSAGSVSPNLVGASHLIFMDPHPNPQLELQLENSLHRVGQLKVVKIIRYGVKGTIEMDIAKLQEAKIELAKEMLEAEEGAGDG